MYIKDKLIDYFGKNIKNMLKNIDYLYFEKAEEIRIRLDRNIMIKTFEKEYFLQKDMSLSDKAEKNMYKPSIEDMRQTIETMSEYSIYAFEKEVKNGFITLKGGFRVGISGRAIFDDEKMLTIKNISSINVRIAREIKGFSDKILKYIYSEDEMKSTIIISKPNCGKTTLLRDIIRQISDYKESVGLVDERSEIASTYMGVPQLDVGIRTDIFDKCLKYEGMLMLLRSMSPSVIAVDEIGTDNDVDAILKISNSGVKILCTMHANDIDEFLHKENMKKIIKKNIFKGYILLNKKNNICDIEKIYNEKFENIYKAGGLKC